VELFIYEFKLHCFALFAVHCFILYILYILCSCCQPCFLLAGAQLISTWVPVCVGVSVCVSVCVIISCEHNISISHERILTKFFEEVRRGSGTNRLDFAGNPDSFVDPGLFSRILYH